MNRGNNDVMRVQFIYDSVNGGKPAPLTVHYFLKMRYETARELRKTMDRYGDSYCSPTDVQSLKRVLEAVSNNSKLKVLLKMCTFMSRLRGHRFKLLSSSFLHPSEHGKSHRNYRRIQALMTGKA
jgi:hypothetical protein